jgi:hypothetical protein
MAKSWIRRSCISSAIFLVACGSSPAPADCPSGPGFDLVFVGSDYSSSQAGGVSLDGRMAIKGSVDLGADPALALSAGRAFLVARDTDTIFELDPKCGTGIGRFSANDGTPTKVNPQDVAVAADGSVVVTRFGAPSLLVIGKDGARSAIDLSTLDAMDGNPEASGVVTIGNRAFVALGVLDRATNFRSTRPSLMAVIDVPSRTIERTVTLAGRNPFGSLGVADGAIWLAEPGNFDRATEKDAGLERFDPQTMTTTLAMTEPMLGASLMQVVVDGACGVAILADASSVNRTTAVVIDITRRRVVATLLVTPGFHLQGLAMSATSLVVGDRQKADAGYPLHVFKRLASCAFQTDHDVFVPAPPIGVRFR